MSDSRLAGLLAQLLQAATDACVYIEGLDKSAFLADKRTQQAVVLNLVVIGEIASRMLNDHGAFVTHHPEVPWRNMKGMRNRIAHGYFEIDLDAVWETVRTALPLLVNQLPSLLVASGEGNGNS